jgi:hypothetical protein
MPIYYPVDRIPSKWEKKNKVTLRNKKRTARFSGCVCESAVKNPRKLRQTDSKRKPSRSAEFRIHMHGC